MTESVISRKTANFLLFSKVSTYDTRLFVEKKNSANTSLIFQVAKEFRTWVQDIKAPEEFFYATLARIDQASAENPGRFSVVQGIVIATKRLIYSVHTLNFVEYYLKLPVFNFVDGALQKFRIFLSIKRVSRQQILNTYLAGNVKCIARPVPKFFVIRVPFNDIFDTVILLFKPNTNFQTFPKQISIKIPPMDFAQDTLIGMIQLAKV